MAGSLKRKFQNFVTKLYIELTKSSLRQEEISAGTEGGEIAFDPSLLRRAAAEGAVLLKNDGTLPLGGPFALFGRTQLCTFYTGYGSGGDVRKPYHVCILEGLKTADAPYDREVAAFYEAYERDHPVDRGGWGDWPFYNPEPIPPDALLEDAAKREKTAVFVVGRAAGEDRDQELTAGGYYLTDAEKTILEKLKGRFSQIAVVLNIGGLCDLSWTEDPAINAVLLLYQGGMEAGNAAADVLTGKSDPCGKLPDTVARRYEDFPSAKNFGGPRFGDYAEGLFVGYRHFETYAPEAVLYPFGSGLSYTSFSVEAEYAAGKVVYRVKNTGGRAGKTVVEVFVGKPRRSPARELAGFQKTALLPPGGEETGEIVLSEREFSVCREEQNAFVLERGEYRVYVGFDVRSADMVASFSVEEDKIVETFSDILHGDLKATILSALPAPLACGRTDGKTYTFEDVRKGTCSAEEFVATLSDEALCDLSRGDFKMDSPLGASGNAGVMGGITRELTEKKIPAVTMTDGPSGVRLRAVTALVPCATLLAATFDPALVSDVYALLGGEMRRLHSDVLLAPAMNLHRDPLCGRNFEYFSEDPFLSGKIAAAAVRGVRRMGRAACVKHYACNNQEYNRNLHDARVGEKPLRELYLRGFEIAVKEGKPQFLMTSYNKVNGVYAHYHYALVRGILRREWGFAGCVVTDWWIRKGKSPHFRHIKNNSYRIRAGVNVLMPGGGYVGKGVQYGSPLKQLGKREGLTRGELQQNAVEIVRVLASLDLT